MSTVARDTEADRHATLRARGLTKIYGSGEVEVRALSEVDLDLYAGELVVLLGALWVGVTAVAAADSFRFIAYGDMPYKKKDWKITP